MFFIRFSAVPRKKAQKKHGKKTKKRKSGIFTGNRFFVLRPRYILQAFRLLFVCYFVDRFVGANGADIRFISLKKALLFRSVPLPRTILP